MPRAALRPCTHPGCGELVADGSRCPKHARAERVEIDRRRGSSASRGYGHKWRRYREAFLAEHPLCKACVVAGRTRPATVVDHIRPHKGDMRLFWDPKNHQALCKACHDAKTAREDGRWS
jgi:5-methylcytosine-specific restriction protein A